MHSRIAPTLLAASLGLLAWQAVHAQANLLSNGSFEIPPLGASSSMNYAVGSTGMPGWTVIAPGVSHTVHVTVLSTDFAQDGFSFPAYAGSQFLDLTGASPSDNDHEGVEQVVPTKAGSSYLVSFAVGNVFDASGTFGSASSVELYLDDAAVGTYTNDAVVTTQEWRLFTYAFTATGPWTKIGLVNADPHSDNHNGLDDVRLTLTAAAAPSAGDLDPAFGVEGVAFSGATDADGKPSSRPVLQADGKSVYCKTVHSGGSTGDDFLVVRHKADGALDESFSFGGLKTIDFDANPKDACAAVAVQADGRIVVAGTSGLAQTEDFAVARLNGDGSLDQSFGNHGKVRIDFNPVPQQSVDSAYALTIQPDGKIVLAGSASATGGTDFALARLNTNGTLDTSFHQTGYLTIPFNSPNGHSDLARAVAIDAAGRIVVAGTVTAATGSDFAVARVLSDGTLDADFNASGRATVAFDIGLSKTDVLYAMTIQHDGRIVLAGVADVSPNATMNGDWAIARLRPDGALDPGFGNGGKTRVPFDLVADGLDGAIGVAETADGKLLIAGQMGGGAIAYGGVARLNAGGGLDPTFGDGGVRLYNLGSGDVKASALSGIAIYGAHVIVSGLAVVAFDIATGIPTFDTFVARLRGDGDDMIFANGFD